MGKKQTGRTQVVCSPDPDHTKSADDRFLRRVVFGAVLLYAILRVITILFFTPGDRVWGVDFPRYILSWDIWIAMLAPCLMCVPAVARYIADVFPDDASPRRVWVYAIVAILGTGAMVYVSGFFRVLYSFLGDSSACNGEVYRLIVIPGYTSFLLDKFSSYFTGQVIQLFAFVQPQLVNTSDPYYHVSILSIVVLVPGLFFLLRKDKRSVLLLFLTLAAGTPAVLYYFGYVELYTIQYTFLILFFVAVYRALAAHEAPWLAVTLLLISSAFGASSLVYCPVAVYTIVQHFFRDDAVRRNTLYVLLSGIVAIFIVFPFLYTVEVFRPYVLPPTAESVIDEYGQYVGEENYSLFALSHLTDVVNVILFNGGFFAIFLMLFLPGAKRYPIWREPLVHVGILAAVAGFLMTLEGHAAFGLARDWDLAAQLVLGIAFFAGVILLTLDRRNLLSLRYVLPAILLTGVSTAYSWVALNHRDESACRLEDIITMDEDVVLPQWSLLGYENLRKYYLTYRDDEKRVRVLQRVIGLGCDASRYCMEAVTVSAYLESPVEAERLLDETMPHIIRYLNTEYAGNDFRYLSPKEKSELAAAMMFVIQSAKPEMSEKYAEILHAAIPDWPLYRCIRLTMVGEGVAPLVAKEMDAHLDTTAVLSHLLAKAGVWYNHAGRYRDAIMYLQKAVEREPRGNLSPYTLLGKLYATNLRNVDSAIICLERGLDNCTDSPQYGAVRNILERLKTFRESSGQRKE